MLLLKASPCSLCAYALLIHEINIKHIRALRFFFLSNASLSLLLTMYWSCQTYFIFSSVVAQYLYPQYFYPFCILLHSVLYICSQFPGFYKHKHVTFFYNLVRFFCFFLNHLSASFLALFSLSLNPPPPSRPRSLSLSFFGYEALVVIIGRWQACRQLHSGESQVPQGAFFYLFVSCNTAPATDLWYPCRARGSQVHPIKNGLKLTLIFPFLKRDCGKRQFHDYRVDFFFYFFFFFFTFYLDYIYSPLYILMCLFTAGLCHKQQTQGLNSSLPLLLITA